MYQVQYLCVYRPVWKDSEEDNPTDFFEFAVTQLRQLYARRRGHPVRILDLTSGAIVGKLGY